MNRKLLTVVCAAGVLFSAGESFSAEESEMMPPPPPFEDGLLPPPPPPGHMMKRPGKDGDKIRHNPKFRDEMHKKMAEKFAEDLGLTDEQKNKAEELRAASRKKMKPLFEQMRGIHQKMDEIREENLKEFEKVLTPEQKAKLEKMKAERVAFRKNLPEGKNVKKHMRDDRQDKNRHNRGERHNLGDHKEIEHDNIHD